VVVSPRPAYRVSARLFRWASPRTTRAQTA